MEVNLSVSQCSNFKKAGYFCILNYFRNVADINKGLHINTLKNFSGDPFYQVKVFWLLYPYNNGLILVNGWILFSYEGCIYEAPFAEGETASHSPTIH